MEDVKNSGLKISYVNFWPRADIYYVKSQEAWGGGVSKKVRKIFIFLVLMTSLRSHIKSDNLFILIQKLEYLSLSNFMILNVLIFDALLNWNKNEHQIFKSMLKH